MQNILYFYYSGTGNTEYLVHKVTKEFANRGINVTLCDVTDLSHQNWLKYNLDDFDFLGFSYPIYAFTSPKNFYQFITELNVSNKNYFIIKDSREYLSLNNSSSKKIIKSLKKKNCQLLYEEHLLLPYNIHFRHSDSFVKQMLLAIDEKLPIIVDEIISGKKKIIKNNIASDICASFVGGLLWRGSKNIGNSFSVDDSCISCQKCVNHCPKHNIAMINDDNQKLIPNFNNNQCMLCMRCIMNCPTNSIHIGHFIKGWEVNPKYDFDNILKDDSIIPNYITKDYKGSMARSYKKYFFKDK